MEKASIPWLALPDSRPGLVPPFVSMHWLGPVTKRNSAECRLDQTARLTMDACRLPLGRLEAGSAWILLASQSGGFFSVLFLSSTEFAPSLLRASPPEYLVILGAPHRVGKRTTIAVPRSRGLVGGCSGEWLRRWEGPGAAGAGSRLLACCCCLVLRSASASPRQVCLLPTSRFRWLLWTSRRPSPTSTAPCKSGGAGKWTRAMSTACGCPGCRQCCTAVQR